MRSLFFVVLIFGSVGCQSLGIPVISQDDSSCYQTVNEQGGTLNSYITMCKTENTFWQRIYFLNNGALAATCYQKGYLSNDSDGKFTVRWNRGNCDNGRSLNSDVVNYVLRAEAQELYTFEDSWDNEIILKKIN